MSLPEDYVRVPWEEMPRLKSLYDEIDKQCLGYHVEEVWHVLMHLLAKAFCDLPKEEAKKAWNDMPDLLFHMIEERIKTMRQHKQKSCEHKNLLIELSPSHGIQGWTCEDCGLYIAGGKLQ